MLNLTDKIDLRRVALSNVLSVALPNLSIYNKKVNAEASNKNNIFKISRSTSDEEFGVAGRSLFHLIIKKCETRSCKNKKFKSRGST